MGSTVFPVRRTLSNLVLVAWTMKYPATAAHLDHQHLVLQVQSQHWHASAMQVVLDLIVRFAKRANTKKLPGQLNVLSVLKENLTP